jgi:penicillin-binding protein-related factor A (putative recombinase)
MTMPSLGKVFEKEVGAGLRKTFTTYFVFHQADIPRSWIKADSIKFMKTQAVDYLVLGRAMNFAFEVKYTQGITFPFSNIRDSQIKFLTEFQEKAGESFIVIGIDYPQPNANLISLTDFTSLRESIGKESINFKYDLDNFGHFFTGLPRVQLKTNYYIDFAYLKRHYSL